MDEKRRQLLKHLQPPPPGLSSPRRNFRLGFWLGHALLLAALFSLLSAAQLTGLFERAEFAAGDAAFNLRGPRAPAAPVLIVAVDDASLQESGYSWPWPRDYLARVVTAIAAGRPAVLALDINLDQPDLHPEADEALAEALHGVGYVVLNGYFHSERLSGFYVSTISLPIPVLRNSAEAIGLINQPVDSDGVMRQLPSGVIMDGNVYRPFEVHVASLYLHRRPYDATLTDFGFLDRRDSLINFRGPAGTFSMVPAFQVANGEVAPETFNGKVVLLGVPASSVRDRFATPFGQFAEPMAGVEILANAIDTLIAGDYIRRIGIEADWPDLSALPFLFIACLAGYLVGHSRRVLVILPALAVVVAVCVLAWGVAFFALRLQLPLAAPLIGLMSGGALSALRPKLLSSP